MFNPLTALKFIIKTEKNQLKGKVAGRDSWDWVFNRNEVCPYIGCEPMLDLLSLRSKNNNVITISFVDFMI